MLDEDPFEWDWASLQKEVDKPFTNGVGLLHDVTVQSLGEEPVIPDWWDVSDALEGEGCCDDTSCIQTLGSGTELHYR